MHVIPLKRYIFRAFLRGLSFAHSGENIIMKAAGIILIIVGIAMLVFRGFSVQTEKKSSMPARLK
jgi:hypothetical protein